MFKKQTPAWCWSALLFIVFTGRVSAQTPTDALMMDKGQICIAALYTHESWDEYWEGTLKRDNGNVGTFNRNAVMPMFALGVINRVNVIAALPWVKTSSTGGQVTGDAGLQDFGLWVKAKAVDRMLGKGHLTLHATLGFTVPVTDYQADYAPFSLGMGCPEGNLRGILQYKLDKGPYARIMGGYHVRGSSFLERDFYYTTEPIYSNEVDVPNAATYAFTVGTWLFDNTLKVEAVYDGMKTLGGFDIRRQDGGFPSNKVIFTRIGGGLQYYFPFFKRHFGLIANGHYVLSGRNAGQSLELTGGITYQFGIWH